MGNELCPLFLLTSIGDMPADDGLEKPKESYGKYAAATELRAELVNIADCIGVNADDDGCLWSTLYNISLDDLPLLKLSDPLEVPLLLPGKANSLVRIVWKQNWFIDANLITG